MKILVFGGTTEGRILAEELTERGHDVCVSVATQLGAEELKNCLCTLSVGKLDSAAMENLMQGRGLVLDATHPYSTEVSRNIREACQNAGVPVVRVCRDSSGFRDAIPVGSSAEAAAFLQTRTGNILLAIGSKELAAYGGLEPERLYPRILPTHPGLSSCEALGIPHRNILALQGPFSVEMNEAIFRQYRIRYLVTRDSGREGGLPEKLEAARRCGVQTLLLGRPSESGLSVEEILKRLEESPT